MPGRRCMPSGRWIPKENHENIKEYNTMAEQLSRATDRAADTLKGTGGGGPYRQEGQETEKPSYWAVLPAAIRYDPEIPASAKLLYAEISSLTDARGYCWASNAYFERLYDLSERTIVRLLRTLEAAELIRIEDGQGGKAKRKIYAGVNPMSGYPDKNVSTPLTKMSVPPDKNVRENKKEIKKENDPPEAPQGSSVPKWKPERFEAFWRYYPAIPDGNGHGRRPAKDRAARAWDRLRPDDQTLARMGQALRRQKESRQWREGVGIPYASTWLNRRAWEEELEDLGESPTGSAGAPFRQGGQDEEEALPWI